MRLPILSLCALAAGLVTGAPAPMTPTPAPAQAPPSFPDTLLLANGASVRCRIVAATPESLHIEYPRSGSDRQRTQTRVVPWEDLKTVDFAMDDDFRTLAAATDPLKDTARLAARWQELAPMLGRPHHPVGELGLAMARLSLRHPEPSARTRALTVCEAVAAGDWNVPRRHHARLLRAHLLAALGRSDEALAEARGLADDPRATPEAAMPAHLLLAEAGFAELKKLEEENPLWLEDDTVRPGREALFHRTLDAALKPSLFHGALEDPATRGLWTAVQVLHFDRNLPAAADCARDLVRLYPESPRAAEARHFLAENRLSLDPSAAPADPPVAAAVAAAGPPTATDRGPLVQRRARYAEPVVAVQPSSPPAPPPAPSPPRGSSGTGSHPTSLSPHPSPP